MAKQGMSADNRDPDSAQRARVFFALWPDAALRGELARAAARLHARHGGRRMAAHSLHLTLVFVGSVAVPRLPELLAMAGSLRQPGFSNLFDLAECWRHNRIGCLGASRVPVQLQGLVHALETGLEGLAIPFDRRPYRPHITLLRNADCGRQITEAPGGRVEVRAEGRSGGRAADVPVATTAAQNIPAPNAPAPEAIAWPARDFVLVKSSLRPEGARYEELGRWPLL